MADDWSRTMMAHGNNRLMAVVSMVLIVGCMALGACNNSPERRPPPLSAVRAGASTAQPRPSASAPPTSSAVEPAKPPPKPTAKQLRLLTFNILATPIYPKLRSSAVLRILEQSSADIIALQEVDSWMLAALADQPWVKRGYHLSRKDGQIFNPGGQLILSRHPIAKSEAAILVGRQRRTVLVAHIEVKGTTLAVATSHMESFLPDGPVRARQLKSIFAMLRPAAEAVLMGDLNFGDGEQPETGQLDASYLDLWTVLHPGKPGFTWNNAENPMARIGAFVGEPSRRLDRILLRTKRWRPISMSIIGNRSAGRRRLKRFDRAMIEMPDRASAVVGEPMIEVFPSDHYGLRATLELRH